MFSIVGPCTSVTTKQNFPKSLLCLIHYFLLDVVDEWIGDWWMGGLMVLSVRIGLVKVHWFDRWMVDW